MTSIRLYWNVQTCARQKWNYRIFEPLLKLFKEKANEEKAQFLWWKVDGIENFFSWKIFSKVSETFHASKQIFLIDPESACRQNEHFFTA